MNGTVESKPARVLLVEDEALICAMMCDALLEHGFAVHAVANAGDALQYLRGGAPVDVLFTDINLPGDLDGALLAKEARALRPDLPVVFASGCWGLLDRLRTLPGTACLPKPYSPTQACLIVDRLVGTPAFAEA